MYDRACNGCQYVRYDSLERIADNGALPCPECGGELVRAFTGKANGIIPDGIPGGVEIRHGLCHEDGTPQKFYSKSEMRAEAKRRGWENRVEHIGSRGSDKNPHTSRWV